MSKPLRFIVGTLIAATVLFTAAQQFDSNSPWWLELSRYLPYPAYLAPAVLALLLSAWLSRGWRLAGVASVMLVALVTMDFHWRFDGSQESASDNKASPPIRLMTYNVKAYKAALHPGGFQALEREVRLRNPDIVVMQDAVTFENKTFDDSRPVYGLPNVFVARQYVVATRLPLKDCNWKVTRPAVLDYVQCTVTVNGVDLDLVTAHFQSPREGLNAARREGLDGAGDWVHNYADRLSQAVALSNELESARRPLIVAGDLNAPEASPVVRALLRLGLRDAFSAAGRGWGYSYGHALKVGFSFLRIDHVLVSDDIRPVDSFVGSPDPSEHRPVIVDFRLAK